MKPVPGIAIVLFLIAGFATPVIGAENLHGVGFGINQSVVDSDYFFDEEDHRGFSIYGKIGYTDRWGILFFYRDMEDDEDFPALKQTYRQVGVSGLYMWRPDKRVRPHVDFGLTHTDFKADFEFFTDISDDGVGLALGGGLEAGSQKVALFADYQVTMVALDEFDDDDTTIADLTLGIMFKF